MGNNESVISKITLAITAITAVIVMVVSIRTCQIAEQTSQIAEQTNQIAEQTSQIAEQTNRLAEQTNQIAEQSNEIAEQATQIAERSYEALYRSNLPVISAVSETYYNEGRHLSTEKIIAYNGGGPLTEFRGYAYAIMEIEFADKGIETHIPLRGYFVRDEYSGNSQGWLLTTFTENNYSYYRSIRYYFREAALEDGYEPSIRLIFILWVHYYDYTGERSSEYFKVGSRGSSALEESDTRGILDSADRSENLAESKGLELYIWELNGQELWDWYKEEILENQSTP